MERVVGIEPTSSAWKAEVLPLNYTRAADGDLPAALRRSDSSPSGWWRGKDSNLRRRKPADLQSAPVGRLGTPPQNEPRILISEGRGVNASLARYLLIRRPPVRPSARPATCPEGQAWRERQRRGARPAPGSAGALPPA